MALGHMLAEVRRNVRYAPAIGDAESAASGPVLLGAAADQDDSSVTVVERLPDGTGERLPDGTGCPKRSSAQTSDLVGNGSGNPGRAINLVPVWGKPIFS
jgi:hypothetical protein